MNTFRNAPFILFTIVTLLISPLSFSENCVKAEEKDKVEDLIIFQNIPEAIVKVENNQLELNALHLYEDGHFKMTSDNLIWHSKNTNVATVDEDGVVTFTGQNGRSFITVTDGKFSDQI